MTRGSGTKQLDSMRAEQVLHWPHNSGKTESESRGYQLRGDRETTPVFREIYKSLALGEKAVCLVNKIFLLGLTLRLKESLTKTIVKILPPLAQYCLALI